MLQLVPDGLERFLKKAYTERLHTLYEYAVSGRGESGFKLESSLRDKGCRTALRAHKRVRPATRYYTDTVPSLHCVHKREHHPEREVRILRGFNRYVNHSKIFHRHDQFKIDILKLLYHMFSLFITQNFPNWLQSTHSPWIITRIYASSCSKNVLTLDI